MYINKELLRKKYEEMKSQKMEESFLDVKIKNIKIFINKKPRKSLFDFKIENDHIYVGTS